MKFILVGFNFVFTSLPAQLPAAKFEFFLVFRGNNLSRLAQFFFNFFLGGINFREFAKNPRNHKGFFCEFAKNPRNYKAFFPQSISL